METMWRAVGRLIVVPLSFLIGALVAGFVLLTLGLERVTHTVHVESTDNLDMFLDMVDYGLVFIGGTTIIPAMIVILIGEIARIRSVLYYVTGGGLSLAAIPLLAGYAETSGFSATDPVVWQVFATAGFAGGFIYWLLAGRWT